jgi:16S rRNA (uracil1498-N3)-methyltransferase
MPPRLFVNQPLTAAASFDLPEDAVRHVQVLRLQPGAALTLFDGRGGEWSAEVLQMGRNQARVQVIAHDAHDRELPLRVSLAVGMPTNERMDTVVEKATELGASAIEPLLCERSVLRLAGERAERRRTHWQGIARAAAEQCGRTRVPEILAVRPIVATMPKGGDPEATWLLLSLSADAAPAAAVIASLSAQRRSLRIISGPEGGLSPDEEQIALRAGALPVSLGPRTLRADTAPLAMLSLIAALSGAS